jgi:hypothetical protein
MRTFIDNLGFEALFIGGLIGAAIVMHINDTRWSYDLCTLTQPNLSCLAQYLGVPK